VRPPRPCSIREAPPSLSYQGGTSPGTEQGGAPPLPVREPLPGPRRPGQYVKTPVPSRRGLSSSEASGDCRASFWRRREGTSVFTGGRPTASPPRNHMKNRQRRQGTEQNPLPRENRA
jgi:hypothetical protein